MSYQVEDGDYVIHKNQLINGGLRMLVEDISEDGLFAKCSYFVGKEPVDKIEWFPLTDLNLSQKGDGGFIH